jgi:hypothetical protein
MNAEEIVAREECRTVEVAGHTCRMVAVEQNGQVVTRFACEDCEVMSNSVTAFDQNECAGEDGGSR